MTMIVPRGLSPSGSVQLAMDDCCSLTVMRDFLVAAPGYSVYLY
jgi:hypothetical protein